MKDENALKKHSLSFLPLQFGGMVSLELDVVAAIAAIYVKDIHSRYISASFERSSSTSCRMELDLLVQGVHLDLFLMAWIHMKGLCPFSTSVIG